MNTAPPAQSASCCSTCSPVSSAETALAIACTLEASDFKERVADIRDLARRSLVRSDRLPLRLILTYRSDARAEVEALVAKEATCCSFLSFVIESDSSAVRLTMTAPVEALAAADELFAHFAPELVPVSV